jgi:hypothetical protein
MIFWYNNPVVSSSLNPRLSYFIGALHSDGTFYLFKDKKRNRNSYRIRFQVGEKSLPMLHYLRQIFATELGRELTINLDCVNEYGTNIYSLGTSVNELLPLLSALGVDKHSLPKSLVTNKRLFCAYLAGLVDGDGDIRIKRPAYPQCEIRITSGKASQKLRRLISRHLTCSARIEKVYVNSIIGGRPLTGTGYKHSFYLSSKNLPDFIKLVYPHVQIKHKREILQRFFLIKHIPC